MCFSKAWFSYVGESRISPNSLFGRTTLSASSDLGNFLIRIGDMCRIDFVDVKSFVSLADCDLCGNGNDFYSTDRLIDCLDCLFDIGCYGSLAMT